jgi:hypothetical protein
VGADAPRITSLIVDALAQALAAVLRFDAPPRDHVALLP